MARELVQQLPLGLLAQAAGSLSMSLRAALAPARSPHAQQAALEAGHQQPRIAVIVQAVNLARPGVGVGSTSSGLLLPFSAAARNSSG